MDLSGPEIFSQLHVDPSGNVVKPIRSQILVPRVAAGLGFLLAVRWLSAGVGGVFLRRFVVPLMGHSVQQFGLGQRSGNTVVGEAFGPLELLHGLPGVAPKDIVVVQRPIFKMIQ